MKIIYFITQADFGGAQRYVFDLAKNFKKEALVGIVAGVPGEKGKLAQKLKEAKISFYAIPCLKRSIAPIAGIKTIFKIIKIIKKTKPDIIHLNSSKISILGSIAAFIAKSKIFNLQFKVIYTVHGWVFNEPLGKIKKTFYTQAEKLTAIIKNKIICINKQDYEIAKNKLKIPEEKLDLIYNGINEKEINLLSKENALKQLSKISTPFSRINFQTQNSYLLIGNIGNL